MKTCSKCHYDYSGSPFYNYCPNCGTKFPLQEFTACIIVRGVGKNERDAWAKAIANVSDFYESDERANLMVPSERVIGYARKIVTVEDLEQALLEGSKFIGGKPDMIWCSEFMGAFMAEFDKDYEILLRRAQARMYGGKDGNSKAVP